MFVVSPVSTLHASASRPRYRYYTPRPSARERYLAAIVQAEAEYACDQALERQRAREAYARRQHQEQLRRQLVLDALQAQVDGYYSCPVALARPWAHTGYAQERAERLVREPQAAVEEEMLERGTHVNEWKRHPEEGTQSGSASRATDMSVRQQNAELAESRAEVESEARLMEEHESDMRDTLRSLIDSIPPNPSAEEATNAARPDSAADASALEASLSAISDIDASFRALEADFELPAELDFDRARDDGELTLAYSSRNAPLRFYDHALSQLLSQLDGVASHGSVHVREARKTIVRNISTALELLEREVQIRKELAASAPVNAEGGVPEPGVSPTTMIEVPATPGSDVSTVAPVAEPPEPIVAGDFYSPAVPLIAGPEDNEPATTADSESIPPVASEEITTDADDAADAVLVDEDTWSEIEA
ncbi:hypothetical protein F5I97DRAFT_1590308 [Phlebopus sp. FC_14]|nr:hypothetical protein F5I97DRAFT_1590308 [Phlebopus sp. FC_14]